MENLHQLAQTVIQWSALIFLLLLLVLVVTLIVTYLIDTTQTQHSIRRNYPIVGRFRYFFEHMGEFFRQYFFAMDREELPFNRAERSWVYRAAKQVDTTIPFGSTRPLDREGSPIFLNSPFPTLDQDAVETRSITIGAGYCKYPYTTRSILHISGMSYGALSKVAVKALSHGAKRAGIWMNTGEGGLSPYHLDGGCDIVFQVGTAKYGVRDQVGKLSDEKLKLVAAHDNVKMIEIKLSQGAKPGKGGILPGAKVTEEIALIRGIEVGKPSISPNAHEEIKSVEDLLDMINHVRALTGKPTGFKMVMGQSGFFEDLFVAIHQRGISEAPDFITLDSADGGTGAAPQPLMDYVGMPIQESLPELVNLVQEYGLRERIKIIVSGKCITPAKVAWAICVGADFCVSARGFMFALGCIQAMQCNKNTCPTGVTTHNPDLQRGLVPMEKAERVAAYARAIEHGVGVIAHSCGVTEPRGLSRRHVRIIQAGGATIALDDLHPMPSVRPEYEGRAAADKEHT